MSMIAIVAADPAVSADVAHFALDWGKALRVIHSELGITSIFVTHDHEEAFPLADRVALLNHGRIEQFAPPAEIAAAPASEFVRAFLA